MQCVMPELPGVRVGGFGSRPLDMGVDSCRGAVMQAVTLKAEAISCDDVGKINDALEETAFI